MLHNHEDVVGPALRRVSRAAPLLDARRERELLRRVHEGHDDAAFRELFESHLRLVVAIASRFARAGVSLTELIAEGNLGLIEAAHRFDLSRSTRFATYAAWWIRARVRRFALGNRRVVGAPSTRAARSLLSRLRTVERQLVHELGRAPTREEIAAHVGASSTDVDMVEAALSGRDVSLGAALDGLDLADTRPTPEDEAVAAELAASRGRRVRAALETLDRREREIVTRRLVDDDAPTLTAIGATLGLSRERVRQLEERAKRKLRTILREVA